MQSKEIVLTQQKIIAGNIRSEYSKIDSDSISKSLRNDFKNTVFDHSNKFYDI